MKFIVIWNYCTKTGIVLTAFINCTFQIPKHQKLVQEEDEDPIVDNNEIDTNNNLDSEWALTVPKTYRSADLRKWRLAPIVTNNYGHPGEYNKIYKN